MARASPMGDPLFAELSGRHPELASYSLWPRIFTALRASEAVFIYYRNLRYSKRYFVDFASVWRLLDPSETGAIHVSSCFQLARGLAIKGWDDWEDISKDYRLWDLKMDEGSKTITIENVALINEDKSMNIGQLRTLRMRAYQRYENVSSARLSRRAARRSVAFNGRHYVVEALGRLGDDGCAVYVPWLL